MHQPENIAWDRLVVYNAVWSILTTISGHNGSKTEHLHSNHPWSPIRSVLVPGLGTGTGNIPYERFASQFGLAVRNFDEALRSPDKWATMDWDQIHDLEDELASSFARNDC